MKDDTKLVHAGRAPFENVGAVNPPVYHASTILFETHEDLQNHRSAPTYYGRHGTPGTDAFARAIADVEHADHCVIVPSGLAAISISLLSFLKTGDHLLMVDTTYDPARSVCDQLLTRCGIETTYYDPLIGADIKSLIKPNTRVVYLESPGSRTFEVQDVAAIVSATKSTAGERDIVTIMDNTWATPLYFKPLDFGVDVSLQSITKYVGGHADLLLGTISCQAKHWPAIDRTRRLMGNSVGADDVYLAQRGLRSLSARLKVHGQNALRIAEWLERRKEVQRVMYPPLQSDPGHGIWRRDFAGGTGLLGFVLKTASEGQVSAFQDALTLFGMGFSWGGYESLLIPIDIAPYRTATQWKATGPAFRISAGLEDPDDLIADLEAAFAVFA